LHSTLLCVERLIFLITGYFSDWNMTPSLFFGYNQNAPKGQMVNNPGSAGVNNYPRTDSKIASERGPGQA